MKSSDAAQLYKNLGHPVPQHLGDPREHKYGARKKEVDGVVFDSTGEARAYQLLKLRQLSGEIGQLELQPVYVLQPAFEGRGRKHRSVTYRPDFRFVAQPTKDLAGASALPPCSREDR